MSEGLNIAFFGSSLLSAYWNGAATYYRGIIRALNALGHRVTFYEPDAYNRQEHRDIEPPSWARVVVYPGEGTDGVFRALEQARHADWIIKASGVGVHDELLEREVVNVGRSSGAQVAFWDVDAPATLERIESNSDDPFAALVPKYDMIFTYGGGDPVVNAYKRHGALDCVPIYNALDPDTHHPVAPDPRFEADLSFLGNRLPDREARVQEFFLRPAAELPEKQFLIGGNGWRDKSMPSNIRDAGHVYTADHNAFNCSPLAVLNINRESMARYGFSPATRVFEAAGAGACMITDAFTGVEHFFEPEREILIARDGSEVRDVLRSLTRDRAGEIGRAALQRVLSEHTYTHRAVQVNAILNGRFAVAGSR
jgi:spore maturation protein CgeB